MTKILVLLLIMGGCSEIPVQDDEYAERDLKTLVDDLKDHKPVKRIRR